MLEQPAMAAWLKPNSLRRTRGGSLIGGPGTGKTHVATALGVQAVEHHRKKAQFQQLCHQPPFGSGEDRDAALHVEFVAAVGVHVIPDQRGDGVSIARREPIGPMGPGENLL